MYKGVSKKRDSYKKGSMILLLYMLLIAFKFKCFQYATI